jgi:alpha-glucosidase
VLVLRRVPDTLRVPSDPHAWWREGVLYQVYPRSFADSDGDGAGDLRGIVERLDHLAWLGVDGIWLNPTMPSPNADWGYDVADYTDVHPDFGTLDDLDALVRAAGERGIRVLLDLVPNHSSERHAWFVDSRSSRTSEKRDWYVWADARSGGEPPNNWRSVFGGGAWTWDDVTQQYYLHTFLEEMPDVNWLHADVRSAFDRIHDFWYARGIAGLRIDVAHRTVRERSLFAESGDRNRFPPTDLEATHAVFRRWRAQADRWDPPRVLVGETYVDTVAEMASFYGSGTDELHLAFNIPFVFAGPGAARLRRIVEETEQLVPSAGWPVWTVSNHDVVRFPTRWCDDDEDRARCVLLILLTLRGTPFLYYGDEIGMQEIDVPRERLRDPVGLRNWPKRGRDGCRTPMQWSAADGAGFTRPGVEPWLPLGDHLTRNVEAQRADPGSTLTFTRDLIALRRELAELRSGSYETLAAPRGSWAWRRGDGVTVAVNLSRRPAIVRGVEGTVRISTTRDRDGDAVSGTLRLEPWQGAVVAA